MAGNWTFAQFKAMLKFELGERPDLLSHSVMGDLYGRWFNVAYMDLTTRDHFFGQKIKTFFPELHTQDESQATIDGRAYINTPTYSLYVESLWDRDTDIKLDGISWDEYIEKTGRADTDSEANPTEWVRRGSRIYLSPTPDAAYDMTIYYRKRINRLDTTNYDVTEIGEEWDEPVLRLAVIQSLMRLKRYDEAKALKPDWLEQVSSLATVYTNEEYDREHIIKPDVAAFNYDY